MEPLAATAAFRGASLPNSKSVNRDGLVDPPDDAGDFLPLVSLGFCLDADTLAPSTCKPGPNMQFASLSSVKARVKAGTPLPFNVYAADGTLLLARGRLIDTSDQLAALFERGSLVDVSEVLSEDDQLRQLPRDKLPERWAQVMNGVADAMRGAPHIGFQKTIDDVATPVVALIDRDPDLAIFQILRQEGGLAMVYGVRRSLDSAITTYLVAQRLSWSLDDKTKAFKVALTMNVSMVELQGVLARQTTLPTEAQREALKTHPARSREMLELAGIMDPDWLGAVQLHHDPEAPSGTPVVRESARDLASLARRAEIYTAKLASRERRAALAADIAGRQMFAQDPGNSMTAALIKEFGVYPPGCYVRLASGAIGVVVERGPTVTTPVVACITQPNGTPVATPFRSETAMLEHQIVGIVGERDISVRIPAEKLLALTVR